MLYLQKRILQLSLERSLASMLGSNNVFVRLGYGKKKNYGYIYRVYTCTLMHYECPSCSIGSYKGSGIYVTGKDVRLRTETNG